ncbi:MAG TPA: ABC transporter substrate-binding protein [Solirubrobacteraceae bacterium]|nr:ABC transporter substrate-binding protein [Solirubrobacteraceae bacterium]
MTRLRWSVLALATAGLLAGCGEITNTLTPRPGTANTLTVALDAPPNFTQAGIVEAQDLGLFAQTDLRVRVIYPADPLSAIEQNRAQIAISNEPDILLARNRHHALAAVAAILQGPQRVSVSCRAPRAVAAGAGTRTTSGSRRATSTTATSASATATATATAATTAPRAHPPLHAPRCRATVTARPDARWRRAPTYNGRNFVVTESEIIAHAPVLRRFVQAVARGYSAVQADPARAAADLVRADPHLNAAAELVGIRASLEDFFPSVANTGSSGHPWGWETVSAWNAFGTWMFEQHIITNPNAIPDADTNELLAGQGV